MNEHLRQRLLIKRRLMAQESLTSWIEHIRSQPPADKAFMKRLMGV